MGLYKRGSTWWIAITAPNGQRLRRSAKTTIKKAAQEYHDRLKADLWRSCQLNEKVRKTWNEAALTWLTDKAHKKSLVSDEEKLRWLDPYFGGIYLDEINRDLIEKIKLIKIKEASPSTVNRYLALIRAILNRAVNEWEWLDRAPKISLYKEPDGRDRWITPRQAKRLLIELPSHLRQMARYTLATGLRQANVSELKWEQIDLEKRTASFKAKEMKNGCALTIPLNSDAMKVLQEQKGKHPVYVFPYNNSPVMRTTTKAWYAALQRAGIENFTWHDFRHTWASWHIQSGTSLKELQELGGWRTFNMVLRYAHLSSNQLNNAADRIVGKLDAKD